MQPRRTIIVDAETFDALRRSIDEDREPTPELIEALSKPSLKQRPSRQPKEPQDPVP